jgi:hypothetical protein
MAASLKLDSWSSESVVGHPPASKDLSRGYCKDPSPGDG